MKKNKTIKWSIVIILTICYIYIASITLNTSNNIQASVIEKKSVIPLGNSVALKVYTQGVLVVGTSEIKSIDSKKYKPYKETKISEGDTILEINGQKVENTKNLISLVNSSKGQEVDIKYRKNDEELTEKIKPIEVTQNEYKIGLWVRDATAGVGTVTFYDPTSGSFGALGHGISDIDTGDLIDISKGELVTTKVVYIQKGENGNPGEMKGTVDSKNVIGDIKKNTVFGIYGNMKNNQTGKPKVTEVAKREEIQKGKATILTQLNASEVKEYEIQIQKIYKNNNINNKSMLIKVTDKELLNKTGGIIQGMSGSPIIQNGKFIGAVTNVFINDPTQGYAIFGDLMMNELDK